MIKRVKFKASKNFGYKYFMNELKSIDRSLIANKCPVLKTYGIILNVPFDEKETAKKYGAKWLTKTKKWCYFGEVLPEELKGYLQN